MSDALTQYYEAYYTDQGPRSYSGEMWENSSRFKWFKQEIQKFVESKGSPNPLKALDIGCGSGTFAKHSPNLDWTGLDVTFDATPAGTKIEKIKCNIEQTPYPLNEQFDVITCSEVLEHLFTPGKVVEEVRRLLKDDGIFLLSTPNHTWIRNILDGFDNLVYDETKSWTVEHIRTYTLDSLTRVLNKRGFKVEAYTGFDGHFCPVANSVACHLQTKLGPSGPSVEELHLWIGESLPLLQHTLGIRAVKV